MGKLNCWISTILLLGMGAALAQDYPNKPVNLILATPPGGPQDTVARLVSDRMKDTLKQPIVVVNRPGAAGLVSYEFTRIQPADGYTLMISSAGLTAGRFMMKAFTVDALKDYTHIGQMTLGPVVVVANADAPYKTLAEFLAYAKANPGKVNMGNSGGPYLMDVAMLESLGGIKVTIVGYPGSAQIQPALAAGQIEVAIDVFLAARPLVQQGKTRFLGVVNAKRSGLAPEVPAVSEFLPGYEGTNNWFGLSGPAGLPPAVVARVNESMRAALQLPDLRKRLNDLGFDVVPGGPDELRAFIARDLERMTKAVELAGIKPQ